MSPYTLASSKGLMVFSLLILGAASYVYTYTLMLEDLDNRSNLPFIESAEFLNLVGTRPGVLTAYPDLLARYYRGPIHKLPEKGGFEDILQEAKEKDARYLIIEGTCINSREQIRLYLHSLNPRWGQIPPEFQLIKAGKRYGLYLIGPEEKQQLSFRAAIFSHLEWQAYVKWEEMLALMGASTSVFDDAPMLSSVKISEFDVMVFADFTRPLDDAERLYLEESIENGLIVIVSGISPPYLAGGTKNLTAISSWFGATFFSEAPREARWKVKFTENAREIMTDINLDLEYAFYTDSDWSTPTGCLAEPESIVFAYRMNDQGATIFLHNYAKGIILFNGPRRAFISQDAYEFTAFLRALILFAFRQKSSH